MLPIIKPRNRIVSYVIPGLLAVFQMLLLFAILALESWSVYYDAGRGTILAGFWCSIIFFVTSISMFCYLCCGKSSACGIYLISINIINLIFAIILIVFTSLFINNPCLCYNILCNIPPWDQIPDYINYPYIEEFRYNCTARTLEKLPILKGLLSCAVLMLVSNIISIVVCIINYIRLRTKRVHITPIQPIRVPAYRPPPLRINPSNQYQVPYLDQTTSEGHYYAPTETIPSAPPMIRSEKF